MKITRNLLDDLYTDDQGSQDLTGLRQPRKMRRETKEKPRKRTLRDSRPDHPL